MDILIAECGPTQLDEEGKCVGQLNEPLSPAGIEQTKQLVAALPGISHILTSPLKPALAMAHAAAERFGLSTKERLVGDGKLMARRFMKLQREPWVKIHELTDEEIVDLGGESDTMFRGRIAELVTILKGMHSEEGKYTLVITHRDVIEAFKRAYPSTLLYGEDGERDTARATLYQFTI